MRIVTLLMNPPCPWAIPIIKSGADVKIYSCKYPKDSMGAEALIEVKHVNDLKSVINQIYNNPLVKNVMLLQVNENTSYGIIESKKCTCRIIGLAKYHILKSRISNDGKLQITLVVDNRHPLEPLVKRLKNNNVDVIIKSSYDIKRDKGKERMITLKQKMIIKYALERGFFDYPRRISVNEIARDLNLSPSTVSEIIRRGLKWILKDYYKNLVIEKE